MGEGRKILYPELYRHFKGGLYVTMGIVIGANSNELVQKCKEENTTLAECTYSPSIHSETSENMMVFKIGNRFYYLNEDGDKDELVMYRSIETGAVWLRPLKMFAEEISPERQREYGQKYRFQILYNKFSKSCYI